MPRTDCLTPTELSALQLGDLPEAALDDATEHLETCPHCEAALQALDGVTDPALTRLRACARGNGAAPLHTSPGQVGGYEVLGELGRGGMGVVYKARHRALKRTVALKVLLAGAFAEPSERQRFRAEAEAVARLQHPNIVQIHEVGDHEDGTGILRTYFTLELVEGGNLADRLRGHPQPPALAAAWIEALAHAMHHAHQRGIVHRDLKPTNVLLTAEGTPKVTDFGIAKLLTATADSAGPQPTMTGMTLGTPSYMAPEQAGGRSRHVGPAADVYALGVILYEALTGRPPFLAATAAETLIQVVHAEPVSPRSLNRGVPRDLETVCLKCLEKEPARRYPSAQALADELGRFLAGRPVQARPVGPAGRAWKWVRRNPVVAALLAAVFVSLAGGAGAFYWKYREAEAAAAAEAKEKRAAESARADAVAERDRAQVAQVAGLLRPFQAAGGLLSIEEAEALHELRTLPTEQLRVLFVERALVRPETAVKLRHRGAAVAHALAGLDRDRAARLGAVVTARLRGAADPRLCDACADLLAALLPQGDSRPAAALVEALARRLEVEKEEGTVGELANRLAALAPRLGAEEAAAAAGALARRLTADSTARGSLSAALVAVAGRVGKAGAAAAVRPLARQLAEASNPDAFDQLSPPLAALLARLPKEEAAALARPAVRKTTALMLSRVHFPTFALAPHLAALAVRMGEEDIEAAARAVAERLNRHIPLAMLRPTVEALLNLAGRLDGKKAAALVRSVVTALSRRMDEDATVVSTMAPAFVALARRLGEEEAAAVIGPAARSLAGRVKGDSQLLAEALARLAACLGKEEAAALTGPLAQGLAERLAGEKNHIAFVALCTSLKAIWEFVGAKDAAATVRAVAGAFVRQKNHLCRMDQASLLGHLGAGRQEEAAAVAAQCLAEAVCQERDWIVYRSLAANFQEAAGRLREADAARAARALAVKLGEPNIVYAVKYYAKALAALASRLQEKEAATLARAVADRMTRRVEKAHDLVDLAAALASLAGRLPRPQAAAAVAPTVHALTRSMAKDISWGSEVPSASLVVLAARMAEPEAAVALRATAGRVAGARSSVELAGLCEALAALAGQLDRKETAGVLTAAAGTLIERLAVEQEGRARQSLAGALTVIGRRLRERELVDLLQAPLCSGQARSLLLEELGRRSGRPFADAWEVVDWAASNRRDLGARIPGAPR